MGCLYVHTLLQHEELLELLQMHQESRINLLLQCLCGTIAHGFAARAGGTGCGSCCSVAQAMFFGQAVPLLQLALVLVDDLVAGEIEPVKGSFLIIMICRYPYDPLTHPYSAPVQRTSACAPGICTFRNCSGACAWPDRDP